MSHTLNATSRKGPPHKRRSNWAAVLQHQVAGIRGQQKDDPELELTVYWLSQPNWKR